MCLRHLQQSLRFSVPERRILENREKNVWIVFLGYLLFWIRNIPILNSLPWLTPHLTRFRTVLFCNRCFRSLSFGLIICGIRPKKNTGYPKFNIRCIPRKDLRSVPISNAKNTTEARFLYASNRTISFIPFRLLSLPHC